MHILSLEGRQRGLSAGPWKFRAKLGLIGIPLGVIFFLILNPLVASSQPVAQENTALVVPTVKKYANEWSQREDPLVTLENGVEMKSSHLFGVSVQNTRYYYRVRYGLNFDPVSRG